jgi:iron-sulfur cluster assembly accessory protein
MQFEVTPTAHQRISKLLTSGNAGSVFRIAIEGGGCQGFSYNMSIEDAPVKDDLSIVTDDVRVVVDSMSVAFLHGASLDWVSDLNGERFEIKNPNAASTCGCGTSFGV